MTVENLISLVSAVAAVAAVAVAIWQARIAVSARADAEAAAAAAAVSERRAIDAAERSAEAQTRAAVALEKSNSDKGQAKRKAFAKGLMDWAIAIRDDAEGIGDSDSWRSIMAKTKKLYSNALQFNDPVATDLYVFVSEKEWALRNALPADVHEMGVAFLEELAETSARWVRGD